MMLLALMRQYPLRLRAAMCTASGGLIGELDRLLADDDGRGWDVGHCRPKRRFAPHSKTLREVVARWDPVKRVVRKILVPTTDASASVMSSTTNRSQAKPTRVTFWNVMYPKVKQELQRKYPRHEWR